MSERRNGAVTALGESALTGWRGAVGKAVARPIAKRTRISEQDIRVAIGLVIIAYALYRILGPSIRALRSSR